MKFVSKLISDPRLFNFIIMTLYASTAIRWLCAGRLTDFFYWIGALIITLAVTFGYH